MAPPVLRGDRLTLRPPLPGDLAARVAFGRDPEYLRLVGGDPADAGPLTREQALDEFERLSHSDAGWAIEFDGRFVGTVFLHSLDRTNRRARVAIGIHDRALWGRGIGEESLHLVLRYAFQDLGLHRVDLRVLEDNTRAIRCYQKCGFQVEGREREGALIAGEWRTDLFMSVLEHEWHSRPRA